MTLRSYILAAALAAVSAVPAASADTAQTERARLLGDYLAGSYARYINDPQAQSRYFQDAYALAPEDIRLGRLALYSALFSDDKKLALKTAQSVVKQEKSESMARAVLAVEAFSRGRSSRVKKYATDPSRDITMGPVLNILAGWNAVDEGKLDRARTIFADLGPTAYFEALGQLQLAKLEARAGNVDKANAMFDAVEGAGIATGEVVLARARFDAARGDTDAALERLNEIIRLNPATELGPMGDYVARLEAGKPLPKLSVKAEAARALTVPAFEFFVRNASNQGAETYLRFARWVDPDYDQSALWLASLLEDTHDLLNEDKTREEVIALYQTIGDDSPFVISARLQETNIYFDQDRDDFAIRKLEKLAEDHPSYYTRDALGRARFFRENWAEALPFYDDLVKSLSEEELAANTEPLRLRGIIYERLDRWPEAEADFKRVLAFEPDDADTLNYLGYTWVDRGENLSEAFEMIERALELQPQSGAITDSLGWAHYKLGRYGEAKTYLEDAVVLTPYSATIIDHLGDAYWKLGRKREAAYQWQRALEYDPTDEERAAIEGKLAAGPNAVPAQ